MHENEFRSAILNFQWKGESSILDYGKMKNKLLVKLSVLFCMVCMLLMSACGKTVNFNLNFMVDGEIYKTVTTAGNETIEMPEDPSKNGYVFDGWYWDEGTWQRPFTADSLLNEKLTENMTVYAKWIVDDIATKNYDVVFHSMGGSEVATQSVLYGALVDEPENPVKSGFIFAGWYKEADYLTKWDFSADTVIDNVTLYAKWDKEPDTSGSSILEAVGMTMEGLTLSAEVSNSQNNYSVLDIITVSP